MQTAVAGATEWKPTSNSAGPWGTDRQPALWAGATMNLNT